jgi:TRAP-type C4-dicarboxylate transport system permease small subunit
MGITAFAPHLVRTTPILGLNLSVTYGFGLIGGALGLAALYGWLCRVGQEKSSPGGRS